MATTESRAPSASCAALQPPVLGSIRSAPRPCSVNLKALDSRFLSTWRRRWASVTIVAGSPSSSSTENASPWPLGDGLEGLHHARRAGRSSDTSLISRLTVFDSTLARSRMSFRSFSRSLPEERMTRRVLDLPLGEVAVGVVLELLGEDEQAVERRAQLVRHVRDELGLVLATRPTAPRPSPRRAASPPRPPGTCPRPRCSCSASRAACSARSSFDWCSCSWRDCSSCACDCACSSSFSVTEVASTVLSTRPMLSVSWSSSDWCAALNGANEASSITARTEPSKRIGRTMMLSGGDSPRPGVDLDVVGRDVGQQDALLLERALADQALAEAEASWRGACAP